jgi:adenine-specific DNA-methyltransferase
MAKDGPRPKKKNKPAVWNDASLKKRPIEQYEHRGRKRINNPPVGLVTPDTDKDAGKKAYAYDPHLDPQLIWAGKKEHTSFEVATVSLHVHERMDPKTIIQAVRRKNGAPISQQLPLFASPEQNPPLREAIDFYKHAHAWSNRMIAGDSLLVMNSLVEKEGMAGKVQMVYVDPPYGIDYASNFQPFTNDRTVKDRDTDLTGEPEMIRAFRDTWKLGLHSYLSYLRDRLLLARDLLASSGSLFLQIGEENLHLVRAVVEEVFGRESAMALIIFRKKMMPLSKKPGCEAMTDFILWYVKSKAEAEAEQKIHQLFLLQETENDPGWSFVELTDGTRRAMTRDEIANHRLLPEGARVYSTISMKPREYRPNQDFNFEFEGRSFAPPGGKPDATPDGVHCWSTTTEGMRRLAAQRRLQLDGNSLRYVLFHDDYPVIRLTAVWNDTAPAKDMRYVVETSPLVVQRCLLMATDPGDIVFDPTCGSGTTAYVAERWGRRWITCDTSRVAITLAKQRLMTSLYDYYELAHPDQGVASGFVYEQVPHLTLGNVANDEPGRPETLYDRPKVDTARVRVTGPFTVEAVPAPTVRPIGEVEDVQPADASVGRTGETLRQTEWREELLKTGIRGKNNQMILLSRAEPFSGTRWLHVDAELQPNDRGADHVREGGRDGSRRIVVSFGPEHAPLEQRQVELAWEEARTLSPRPAIIVFAAFQFDPEAAKDIDELTLEKTGMTFLKVQMNPDLLTEDLKKKRASNESFWLMGQPDVELRRVKTGPDKDKLQVELHGFDYFNTKTGQIESGDTARIALWLLDTDYDGRSLYPRQVFFPLADEKGGWARLARSLRAEIDETRIEAYRGTVSLPFEPGKRVAVKIVDDRGIESLKVLDVRD